MEEQDLLFEQKIFAVKIFLNTFGLRLGNCNNISDCSEIKIIDKNKNVVGTFSFDNEKLEINVKSETMTLKANCNKAKVFKFINVPVNHTKYDLFKEWQNNIVFEIETFDEIKLNGNFFISCSMDSNFNINYSCHPVINGNLFNKKEFTLKMLSDGSIFSLKISSNRDKETIDINPWNELDGFYTHELQIGSNNNKDYLYRYSGVVENHDLGESDGKIHVFKKEKNNLGISENYNKYVEKETKGNYLSRVCQKSILINTIDPLLFKIIKELKNTLIINDMFLLNNLLNICYNNYTNEEIKYILGLEREELYYLNESNSQKKLLKNNTIVK